MATERKSSIFQAQQVQSKHLLLSAREYLFAAISQNQTDLAAFGGLLDNEAEFANVSLGADENDESPNMFSIVSPTFDENGYRFGVIDECAKLNINTISRWESREAGSGKAALMKLPGMTESIAEAILDWIDKDNEARTSGAEAEVYNSSKRPIPPNGPISLLEELLLVKGVTRKLLYGESIESTNTEGLSNGGLSNGPGIQVGSSPTSSISDDTQIPWSRLLTVHSGERNVDSSGEPRIFLNNDNLSSLHSQLDKAIGTEWANFIIILRQYGPSSLSGSSTNNVQSNSEIELDFERSGKFYLKSIYDLLQTSVLIVPKKSKSSSEPKEETKAYQSPFFRSSDYAADLVKVLDQLTINPGPSIRGRINVNSAPREVLSAIPNIDLGIVERIIAGQPLDSADESPNHPSWLLERNLLNLEEMKKIEPYIGARSDVFRATIVVRMDELSSMIENEILIDATGFAPRQLYCLDKRNSLFPPKLREFLLEQKPKTELVQNQ